ncbi:MAG: hypothetical protein JJ902_23070 [Roseibium sp.]|nr:hypothetical protein [Roseibium sp.]
MSRLPHIPPMTIAYLDDMDMCLSISCVRCGRMKYLDKALYRPEDVVPEIAKRYRLTCSFCGSPTVLTWPMQ